MEMCFSITEFSANYFHSEIAERSLLPELISLI